MFRFLYRNLFSDRSRTALSVLAVGSAIMLLVVLEGFKAGLWQQVRSYQEQLPVQLEATSASTSSSVQMRSSLSPELQARVETVPGVLKAHPLVSTPAIFSHRDMKTPITVIGYDGAGGPWLLREGRMNTAPGETVIDYALAKKHGLYVGNKASIFGREFSIVGLSDGTASMLGSYTFVGIRDAYDMLGAKATPVQGMPANAPSLLLVEVAPGFQVSAVRSSLESAVPSVDVHTPQELAGVDVAAVRESVGSAISLMVFVAYLVGILVIGLTMYATVFERLREAGIMKAIGAGNGHLYRYVLGQAVVLVIAGFAVGLLGGMAVARFVSWLAPQYLVVPFDSQVLLRSGIASLLIACVASLLPIRQMASVDPALVFRQ